MRPKKIVDFAQRTGDFSERPGGQRLCLDLDNSELPSVGVQETALHDGTLVTSPQAGLVKLQHDGLDRDKARNALVELSADPARVRIAEHVKGHHSAERLEEKVNWSEAGDLLKIFYTAYLDRGAQDPQVQELAYHVMLAFHPYSIPNDVLGELDPDKVYAAIDLAKHNVLKGEHECGNTLVLHEWYFNVFQNLALDTAMKRQFAALKS